MSSLDKALDPNSSREALEEAVRWWPEEVLANPAVPLLLLEDPAWRVPFQARALLVGLRSEQVGFSEDLCRHLMHATTTRRLDDDGVTDTFDNHRMDKDWPYEDLNGGGWSWYNGPGFGSGEYWMDGDGGGVYMGNARDVILRFSKEIEPPHGWETGDDEKQHPDPCDVQSLASHFLRSKEV